MPLKQVSPVKISLEFSSCREDRELQPNDIRGGVEHILFALEAGAKSGSFSNQWMEGSWNTVEVELKTPEEWQKVLGFVILDPDGWRHKGAPSWHQAITREEFDQRAAESTAKIQL